MASTTYFVVVTFDRTEDGDLVPGEAAEASTSESAQRRARAVVPKHAGAVAFSRTGDPATGEYGEAQVIASIGAVALEMLAVGD